MRARNIKPGFFVNEDLAQCDPLTRIMFIGLWCLADRDGRLEDRPKKIKMEVLPGDNCDPDAMLDTLNSLGLIVRYRIENRPLIWIPAFLRHQRPHNNESVSTLPPYDEALRTMDNQGEKHFRPKTPDTLITDSLIPDSLNPDTKIKALSGKPDVAHPAEATEASPKNNGIPYADIIQHLNDKTGKGFKPTNKTTRTHISARWNEGYRLEDFMRVIDVKAEKWGSNPEMIDYLRPQTLFGTKFESYLNEARASPVKSRVSKATEQTIRNLQDWEPPA